MYENLTIFMAFYQYFFKDNLRKISIFLILGGMVIVSIVIQYYFPERMPAAEFRIKEPASEAKYNFSLLYVVLYDDSSDTENINKEPWESLLELYKKILYQESLGKIAPEAKLEFLNVKEIGDKKLNYSKRTTSQWFNKLDKYYSTKYSYNILAFSPIQNISWCQDAPSFGFNQGDKIYFCLEAFPTPDKQNKHQETSTLEVLNLIFHKIFHGFGYHHADINYKQLSFLGGGGGIPNHYQSEDNLVFFLNKHLLGVLNILPKDEAEKGCPDREGFLCILGKEDTCKFSYGSYCLDIDGDEIIDSKDPYPFNSPLVGEDSDGDGVIDQLDLCGWNKIEVNGSLKPYDKMKLILQDIKNAYLTFKSGDEHLNVNEIKITPMRKIRGYTFNPALSSSKTIARNYIISDDLAAGNFLLWRIQVYYEHEGKKYYRPYWLYHCSIAQDFEYLYEKEWYYFNRFGCDMPTDVNPSETATYDKNEDRLPDSDKFDFAEKINQHYDWDGDGVADIYDSLPTVQGGCSDNFVKGVLDSDKDGPCDPVDFYREAHLDPYELSFKIVNPTADQCPYLYGDKENKGCPHLKD